MVWSYDGLTTVSIQQEQSQVCAVHVSCCSWSSSGCPLVGYNNATSAFRLMKHLADGLDKCVTVTAAASSILCQQDSALVHTWLMAWIRRMAVSAVESRRASAAVSISAYSTRMALSATPRRSVT